MTINVMVTAVVALVIVVFIIARQIIQLPVTQRSLLMPLVLSVVLGGPSGAREDRCYVHRRGY